MVELSLKKGYTELAPRKIWSKEELEILRNNYSGSRSICTLLPERSWKRIKDKASLLGLGKKENTYTAIKEGFASGKRVANRKFSYTDTMFSEITCESAYWAGFIAADGCITDVNGRYALQVGLSSVDEAHLSKLSRFLCYSGKLYIVPQKGRSHELKRLIINGCNQTVKDLANFYNITPRKTHTLIPPNIKDVCCIKAYIAGYIDGDGCIRINKKGKISLAILGTLEMLEWIRSIFDSWHKGKTNKIYKPLQKNVYTYAVTGKKALTVLQILAGGKHTYMERKWDKLYEYTTQTCRNQSA